MILDYFLRKRRNRKVLDYLEIHITDHCNLNCACCCHFAPLAEKYFMSKEHFKNDLERLSFLSKGKINRIRLMGGEPLLHPNIIDLMQIARTLFQESDIAIHSNGILLSSISNEFWEACERYKIGIILSYYPVDIDYTNICSLAKKHNVCLKTEIDTGVKKFRNFKLDLTGKQSYIKSWFYCTHADASVNLYEGKLYTCDITAHSKHLAKYFHIPLEYEESDYINIYHEHSMDDILKKLNAPHPFCKYCCPNDSKIIDWKISDRKLSEWAKV